MALAVALTKAAELEEVIQNMEKDVHQFAAKVAELFTSRCTSGLSDCSRNNYHHCLSTLPNATCPASKDFIFKECDGCGARFDFTTSTVYLPEEIEVNGNPIDPKVIESICYSRQLDPWFKEKHENNTSYWAQFGADPPQMFFSAPDGTFRIFPGRHNCSNYDPRERPWYVAASSGPKNIMLVLDTSGSMGDPTTLKLDLLKKAAKRVVNTLTANDRIGIVRFSDNATSISPDGRMLKANETIRKMICDGIDKFEAGGDTIFDNAFEIAFDVISSTMEEEGELVVCNSAILFLTDGEITEQENLSESNLISQIVARLEEIENAIGKPVLLFTFSVSGEDDNVHRFPKNLACAFERGVWSKITDPYKIVESLESYYKLFALGLGQGGNQGVAWVEPYSFFTGGVKGTTVSAPVYDEFGNLVGVVGIDFTLEAINKAVRLEDSSQEALDLATKDVPCPSLNLSFCELESFRHQGAAGNDALCYCSESQSNCTANCTEEQLIKTEPDNCSSVSDHPEELYGNTDNEGTNSTGVVCCDENDVTSQCHSSFHESTNTPSSGNESTNSPSEASSTVTSDARNSTAIIGGVVGTVGTLFLMVASYVWYKWRKPISPVPVPVPVLRPPPSAPSHIHDDSGTA